MANDQPQTQTQVLDTNLEKPRARRVMPISTLPPFDLGQLADREDWTPEDRAEYEPWRGWTVTYRNDLTMNVLADLRSGDDQRVMDALSRIVVGWNFVDEDGKPLPQPTRGTFQTFALPDGLYYAMIYGYYYAYESPKATKRSS